MRKGYFHLSALLDRSGSMASIIDDMIGGFNNYIAGLRHQTAHATCTLAQFDNVYELLFHRVPLSDLPPRTRENYTPRDMTALYDAMARIIDDTGTTLAALPEHERPERVLMITVSDGLENASRQFGAADVRRRVEHQRNVYQWEFVFLGANQDAVLSAADLGIPRRASMTYAANTIGTLSAWDSLRVNSARYGATGQAVSFSAADRALQANAGAHCEAANDPVFDQTGPQAATGTDDAN